MNVLSRRNSLSIFAGGLAAIMGVKSAKAQFTEQEVRNGLQVTSTGNVDVDQAASGDQTVFILDDGTAVTDDGVYRTATSQTVVNDGQITSTGDVTVSQSASGQQEVRQTGQLFVYDGMPAETCNPGHVLADPSTGQLFFQANDCCYYPACADECKTCKRCG